MDQHFKSALSTPPAFTYDPEAWDVLQKRLDEADHKPKGIILPRWAAALAFLLLFGLCSFTSFLTFRLNTVGRRLALMEIQLEQSPDTVWLVKNNWIRDTVNLSDQPLLAKQSAGNWIRRFPLFQPGAFFPIDPADPLATQSAGLTPEAENLPALLPPNEVQEEEEVAVLRKREERALHLLPSAEFPMPLQQGPSQVAMPAIVVQESKGASWAKRTTYQALQKSKPKSINLTGGGSITNFFSMPGSGFSSYILQVGGEFKYGSNWSVEAGLELLHLSFELKDEKYFEGYPTLMADDPSDYMQDLYITLNYLQLPLSVKYYFSQGTTVQPYLKASAVLRQARRQSFDYEFTGPGGAYYRPLSIQDDGIYLSSFRVGPGFSMPLARNWGLFAEALYHHDYRLGKMDYTSLRYFGINAGLTHRLY